MKYMKALIIGLGLTVISQAAFAATYTVDKSHTTLGFAVKHLVISKTTGQFNDYEGSLTFDADDLASFDTNFVIQVQSIDTNNEGRDKHLRSADFFDVEQFPTITFDGKSISKTADGYDIVGDLTMKDVTKEITIPVEIAGPVANPYGGTAIGLEGKVKINRQDWGISFSKVMEAGGLVVDDQVELRINFEGHNK